MPRTITRKQRILANAALLVFMAAFITVWLVWANRSNEKFRKHEIHSTIIEADDWWKRSMQFKLRDGYSFYVAKPSDTCFEVGDSVYKPVNSTILTVYRRNYFESSYRFRFIYDIDHPLDSTGRQ
jgi:hypothetical protein